MESMSPWEEDGLRAGRQTLALVNANGSHAVTGLVSLAPHQERALGLCMACGLSLEVLYTPRGPIITGDVRSTRCSPHPWWERTGREEMLRLLALLARRDPAFLAYHLAAYGRGRGLTDDEALAKTLHLTTGALHRLELYPVPRAPCEPLGAPAEAMARVIGIAPAHLGAVLVEARQVLEAEAISRLGQEGENIVAQARAAVVAAERALQAAQAHLESLCAAPTERRRPEGH